MKTIYLKLLAVFILCALTIIKSKAQPNKIDSLRHLIDISNPDTNRVDLLIRIGNQIKKSSFLTSRQAS